MNLDRIDRRFGVMFAILSAVFFGMMPLFTKTAYAYGCNAYTVAFGRFLVGALGSGIIIILLPDTRFRGTQSEFQKLAGLSVFYAATPVLLYEAYRGISTGLATTLHFTYPVIVIMIGSVAFHDRLHARQIICLFICIAGITCFYKPWQGWLAIIGLGLFATVLALALFQLGVFLCGDVKASLLSTFEPLTGVIPGVLVFHETLTPRIVAGIALILLSTLLLVMECRPGLSRGENR